MSDSTVISVTEARQKLFRLVDRVNESHESITIVGKRGNAVLVSEEDWPGATSDRVALVAVSKDLVGG